MNSRYELISDGPVSNTTLDLTPVVPASIAITTLMVANGSQVHGR